MDHIRPDISSPSDYYARFRNVLFFFFFFLSYSSSVRITDNPNPQNSCHDDLHDISIIDHQSTRDLQKRNKEKNPFKNSRSIVSFRLFPERNAFPFPFFPFFKFQGQREREIETFPNCFRPRRPLWRRKHPLSCPPRGGRY